MSGLLRGLEVAFPQIDVDACLRLGGVSPQLTRLEAHAVEWLGARPPPVGIGVRQAAETAEDVDAPAMPARIAGQPRVTAGLPVARDDGVSRLEAGRGVGLALLGHALAHRI